MCYCAKILENMQLAKEKEEAVVASIGKGKIFVEYNDEYDEYTLRYFWFKNETDEKTLNELKNTLTKYSTKESINKQKLDIINIGMVGIFDTNPGNLCDLIELTKNDLPHQGETTKYVFFGKKVLNVTKYCGKIFNTFDCMDDVLKWEDSNARKNVEGKKLTKIMQDIYYYKVNDNIIFSIGTKYKNTVFTDSINESIPSFLVINPNNNVVEYNIII